MFLIMCLCISCGSKKKLREKNKVDILQQNDVVITDQKDIVSNTTIRKTRKEIIYEPIDPDKPIKINDSTFVKNAKVTIRDIEEDSHIAIRDSSRTELKDKTATKIGVKQKTEGKEVEGNSNDVKWSIWGIFGILLLLIILFLIFRKKIFNHTERLS